MSVSETTPTRRPEMRAPGRLDAEMEGPLGAMKGVFGLESMVAVEKGSDGMDVAGGGVMWCWPLPAEMELEWLDVGTRVALWRDGVGGPEEEGETGSVIHMRWLFVATSLATVCAKVESGVTWNTGKESLPSFMPRVDRMTVMKWMQVLRRRGSDEDLVSSLTSTLLMLPITLALWSITGREETPSFRRSVRASARGRSPLRIVSKNVRNGEGEAEAHLIATTSFDPIFRSRRCWVYN